MKINLVGAFPPPDGGTTILLKQLKDELLQNYPDVDLVITDTSLIRRHKLGAIFSFFKDMLYNTLSSDINSVHVSKNGSTYLAPIVLFISLISNKKFHFRMFGGVFDEYYKEQKGIKKILLNILLERSDLIYFETKGIVNYFKDLLKNKNIVHYSNSRKKTNVRKVLEDNKIMNFIFVGAVKESKGVDLIIKASEYFPKYKFKFAGPCGDEMKSRIIEKSNCIYLGNLEPRLIQNEISNNDCLLLPTYHFGEGYPGVILEAYSVGVPVITSDWQYIPEIVFECETGFIVKSKDLKSLIDGISKMSSLSSSDYEFYSKSCIRNFNERFVSSVLTEKFVSDMNVLMNKGR
ncbi:glycosyltransferase family 4 protein [Vibrio vulnificus]|uniref:glycosyltransferase family 4 protein n=1 Tax=Vibrio vulnificus TaxID=672 RepID=UPI003242B142